MDSPFYPLFLMRLAPFKHVQVRISRTDGDMSFIDFCASRLAGIARVVELPCWALSSIPLYLAAFLLLLALTDGAWVAAKRLKPRVDNFGR